MALTWKKAGLKYNSRRMFGNQPLFTIDVDGNHYELHHSCPANRSGRRRYVGKYRTLKGAKASADRHLAAGKCKVKPKGGSRKAGIDWRPAAGGMDGYFGGKLRYELRQDSRKVDLHHVCTKSRILVNRYKTVAGAKSGALRHSKRHSCSAGAQPSKARSKPKAKGKPKARGMTTKQQAAMTAKLRQRGAARLGRKGNGQFKKGSGTVAVVKTRDGWQATSASGRIAIARTREEAVKLAKAA